MPLLVKKRSYLNQSTDIVKNVTYDDVVKCTDREEAEKLINDTFASDKFTEHIEKTFGKVKSLFHINYKKLEIIYKFLKTNHSVTMDEIKQFEETLSASQGNSSNHLEGKDEVKLIEESSFEDLLNLTKDEFSSLDTPASATDGSSKKKKGKEMEKLGPNKNVLEDIKKKDSELIGLENQIFRSGFLVFEDRISKLKMMNSPLFLFGMKLFRQTGHMEFFDSEFCTTVLISSDIFSNITLRESCSIINEMLLKTGFEGDLLKIGKLKDLGDEFDLGKILVRPEYFISMRFNSFQEALSAFQCLSSINDKTRGFMFKCRFMNP
jgi:hypothetical protein